mmetsp:Transcript_2121/g.2862  ORF Transcript_2121/g.2862 Transcript_2121/m.2862 type:complete len:235 (-) Transcript_2121:1221-1925(-)
MIKLKKKNRVIQNSLVFKSCDYGAHTIVEPNGSIVIFGISTVVDGFSVICTIVILLGHAFDDRIETKLAVCCILTREFRQCITNIVGTMRNCWIKVKEERLFILRIDELHCLICDPFHVMTKCSITVIVKSSFRGEVLDVETFHRAEPTLLHSTHRSSVCIFVILDLRQMPLPDHSCAIPIVCKLHCNIFLRTVVDAIKVYQLRCRDGDKCRITIRIFLSMLPHHSRSGRIFPC